MVPHHPYPNIDPVFLHLGPLQFRWYGLMYLIGLTLAYFIIGARAKAQNLPLNKDQVYDMIVYAAVESSPAAAWAMSCSITCRTTSRILSRFWLCGKAA
ncbi:MAG: prolipoprotein diacylglyceryl transferase family protein [Nitrospiraceae bacterium]